jgi:hypothetical protein
MDQIQGILIYTLGLFVATILFETIRAAIWVSFGYIAANHLLKKFRK